MRETSPKVFLIGESSVVLDGLQGMLDELGVPDWTTDAHSPAEVLSEVAGKLAIS